MYGTGVTFTCPNCHEEMQVVPPIASVRFVDRLDNQTEIAVTFDDVSFPHNCTRRGHRYKGDPPLEWS